MKISLAAEEGRMKIAVVASIEERFLDYASRRVHRK
jgi:hypothetical protein